jgi:hypothetical protein
VPRMSRVHHLPTARLTSLRLRLDLLLRLAR